MADFEVVRSTSIAAPAERIHGLIDDFHAWRSWSPWEEVDPEDFAQRLNECTATATCSQSAVAS